MASGIEWMADQIRREGNADISHQSNKDDVEPTFVEWEPETDEHPRRKHPPRLYHKKSRNGCTQCRARRVKCDEIHPQCGNCRRHTSECTYDRAKKTAAEAAKSTLVDRTQSGNKISESNSTKNVVCSAPETPESQGRRLLELGLLHRYMSETGISLTVFVGHIEEQKYWWTVAMPRKAFKHEALLNSLYATTALHWSKLEPDNPEAIEAHRKYMGLTLSGHRNDVADLTKENADAVCLTSSFIRICIFSELGSRDLEPYTPPFIWLKTTQISGEVWVSSWKWIKDDENSIARAFMKSTPALSSTAIMFRADNRRGLDHLLRSNPEEDAIMMADPTINSAYENTVSYIGGVKLAIAAGEPSADIMRRLVSFPMFISRKFTPLVEECQPRALVIMCHYFALLTELKDFWWVANAAEREIRAVEKMLPPQWLPSMAWPLRVLDEPSILTPTTIQDSSSSPEDTGAGIEPLQTSRGKSAYVSVPFKPSNRNV